MDTTCSHPDRVEITVVVPVFGQFSKLAKCLESLRAQTYRGAVEIIVVDNHPTPTIETVLGRMPGIVVVHEPRPGSYSARNAGLARAQGDAVAFTDADCEPTPDWLTRALDALRSNPGAAAVGGHIELFTLSETRTAFVARFDRRFGLDQQSFVRDFGFAATANLVVRREAFERIGFFNAALFSAGDVEFCHRLRSAGLVLEYAPGCIVRHQTRGSLRELLRASRRHVGGQMRAATLRTPGPLASVRAAVGLMPLGVLLPPRPRAVAHHARAMALTRPLDILRLVGLLWLLKVTRFVEIIRLLLGGTPERR